MVDFSHEFHEFMREHGYDPKNGKIQADNRRHPAYVGGEKKEAHGQYSLKIVSADWAVGYIFDFRDKDGTKKSWHPKNVAQRTPEERKADERRYAEEAKALAAAELRLQTRVSNALTKIIKKYPRATDHPYLTKKGIKAHGLFIRKKGNELILPIYQTDGKIWTLQRITPSGGKFLFKNGRKKGGFFPFVKPSEYAAMHTALICEGFSTGASLREATGIPTFACIDANNLSATIQQLKNKYPDTKFIICADNDTYSKNAKKELFNVGVELAKRAAVSIQGARVVFPVFENNTPELKLSDFNDLHKEKGLHAVKSLVDEAIKNFPDVSPTQEIVAAGAETSVSDQHTGSGDLITQSKLQGDFGMNFKILGYKEDRFYYFSFGGRKVINLSATSHNLQNFFHLDELDNWTNKFGSQDGKVPEKKMVTYATNAMIKVAHKRGVFNEEDRIRGAGAWIDKGRKVLHCGDILYVDGVETEFDQLESKFTYVGATRRMRPAAEELTTEQGRKLRDICEAITWENKLSGSLLAGFLVIAPVCGALTFRPHIYLTGEAESGKSTVIDKIIKPVLGDISLNADGGTTEPKLREMMGYDARPIVYDEAEKSPSMADVIGLSRKSSTGAIVGKFGQRVIRARFCFCFSGINPPVNKTADESRISFMVIKKNRRPTAIEEYNKLLEMIEDCITEDFSNRLITRTLNNMETLFANIQTFERAARRVIKGARAAQVIGAMLGGLWLLHSTELVDADFAEEWIAKHDWTDHTIIDDDTDPIRLLHYIANCIVKIPSATGSKEMSIGDAIVLADEKDIHAIKYLGYHGVRVKDKRVYFASRSENFDKLLSSTDWGATKWTRMLSNLPDAEHHKTVYFNGSLKTSAMSIPLSMFDGKEEDTTKKQLDVFDEEIPL